MAVFDGMRPGEILAIRVGNISDDSIRINQRLYKGTRTARRAEKVETRGLTRAEFMNEAAACRERLEQPGWFLTDSAKKINRKKGVVDISTRVIQPPPRIEKTGRCSGCRGIANGRRHSDPPAPAPEKAAISRLAASAPDPSA